MSSGRTHENTFYLSNQHLLFSLHLSLTIIYNMNSSQVVEGWMSEERYFKFLSLNCHFIKILLAQNVHTRCLRIISEWNRLNLTSKKEEIEEEIREEKVDTKFRSLFDLYFSILSMTSSMWNSQIENCPLREIETSSKISVHFSYLKRRRTFVIARERQTGFH